ncbi:MAG: TIGR02147 family protein, partial [Proteobacteria bacterium]
YYFAVFNLLPLEDFEGCPFWISKRLRITTTEAKQALERLERIGMIARNLEGHYFQTQNDFKTTSDLADLSIRQGHYQNLDLARRSLDEDAVLERDFSEITMAIDPQDLPMAKEKIKKFRRELCTELESKRRREVYRMCVQLFPLTRNETGRKVSQ